MSLMLRCPKCGLAGRNANGAGIAADPTLTVAWTLLFGFPFGLPVRSALGAAVFPRRPGKPGARFCHRRSRRHPVVIVPVASGPASARKHSRVRSADRAGQSRGRFAAYDRFRIVRFAVQGTVHRLAQIRPGDPAHDRLLRYGFERAAFAGIRP